MTLGKSPRLRPARSGRIVSRRWCRLSGCSRDWLNVKRSAGSTVDPSHRVVAVPETVTRCIRLRRARIAKGGGAVARKNVIRSERDHSIKVEQRHLDFQWSRSREILTLGIGDAGIEDASPRGLQQASGGLQDRAARKIGLGFADQRAACSRTASMSQAFSRLVATSEELKPRC